MKSRVPAAYASSSAMCAMRRASMAVAVSEYMVHAPALNTFRLPVQSLRAAYHEHNGAGTSVRASIRAGVRRVIALSTNKAANPSQPL